jgi:hypothetical protein
LGLSFVGAVNLSFILAILVAASGAYLFGQAHFGRPAGLLVAVAYVYAPYHLFNALSRGSFPAVWATAGLPFTFWAFNRLRRSGQARDLALSAVGGGLLWLTHNISSLIFLPLLMAYQGLDLLLAALWPPANSSLRHRFSTGLAALLPVILALLLSLGLAAFFLLPAVLEKEFVQIERVITPPDFDYQAHFVNLSELFSLPQPANTGLLNPDSPLTLGLAQVGLGAIGLILLALKRPLSQSKGDAHTALLLFTLLGLATTIFMMLPISVGVWDRIPLLAFVQHPTRLLSLAAFLLAILAGMTLFVWPEYLRLALGLAGTGLIVLTAVPLLYPGYTNPLPAPLTLAGMFSYEQAVGAIGTTSFGEYVPIWVKQLPRESPLLPLYQAQRPIERLDPAYLPAGARLEMAHYEFNQAELVIDSPEPYTAVFHTFFFPGWQASVDDQAGRLGPISERGLVGVTMPAGRHTLRLSFQDTPIRRVANGISLVSALVIGLIAWRGRLSTPLSGQSLARPGAVTFWAWLGLAGLLIGLKIVYFDRYDNPLKQSFSGPARVGAEVVRPVNFGHELTLLGYDLAAPAVVAGQSLAVTAYWQARQPLATNYSSLAQLVDAQQHLFAGQDNLHPGNLPTTRWPPWGFVRDPHRIQIPPGTPPGDYLLLLGPYEPTSWRRLPVISGGEAGWPDVVPLPVKITGPDRPPTLTELGILWPVDASMQVGPNPAAAIRLLGATPERLQPGRNDFFRVALFWEALTAPTVAYQVQVRLVAAGGQVALTQVNQPSYGRYPTTRWQAGERVRDNHAFWLSPDFPAGPYELQVRLLADSGQPLEAWLSLGQVTVLP